MNTSQLKSASEATRTVLMVDEHGRIRTIDGFHKKLRIGIIFTACALLVAAGAGWLYIDGLRTQRELRQQIDTLQARVADAEHQKELLLARAVKAEARVAPLEAAQTSASRTQAASSEAGMAAAKHPPSPTDKPAADRSEVTKEAAPTPSPKVPAEPEPVLGVAVEKLEVAYLGSEKVIASEFTIRNTGNTQAKGRAVVVLSAGEDGNAPRLSLPSVPLNNGRPQGGSGSRFAIKRFMRLKIQRKVVEPGLTFDTADVFVFDMQGKLLQTKTFAVTLQTPEAKPSEPATAVSADKPAVPEATEPPASDSILAIPSNSRQEPQGGQEDE